jgi:hypothetical protein
VHRRSGLETTHGPPLRVDDIERITDHVDDLAVWIQIFEEVEDQCVRRGLVSPSGFVLDSRPLPLGPRRTGPECALSIAMSWLGERCDDGVLHLPHASALNCWSLPIQRAANEPDGLVIRSEDDGSAHRPADSAEFQTSRARILHSWFPQLESQPTLLALSWSRVRPYTSQDVRPLRPSTTDRPVGASRRRAPATVDPRVAR